MDQEDYLLREIAKIGLLLRAILGSLLNKRDNLAISTDIPFEAAKELLLNEIHLDLEKLKDLDEGAMYEYILQFNGINTENLELLGRGRRGGRSRKDSADPCPESGVTGEGGKLRVDARIALHERVDYGKITSTDRK